MFGRNHGLNEKEFDVVMVSLSKIKKLRRLELDVIAIKTCCLNKYRLQEVILEGKGLKVYLK